MSPKISEVRQDSDGTVRFGVRWSGWSAKEWLGYFTKERKLSLTDYTELVLRTMGEKRILLWDESKEVVLLPPPMFRGFQRKTVHVLSKGRELKLERPPVELSFLLSAQAPAELIGIIQRLNIDRIVVMHEPVDDGNRGQAFFTVKRVGGVLVLEAYQVRPETCWESACAFAFLS